MKNIAIFSVPRSGSTWLGQIFNSAPDILYRFQPNFAYSFPHRLYRDSNREQINQFHHELIGSNDPFVNGELSISGHKNIKFSKTLPYKALVWKEVHHLYLAETLVKNSSTKVIGLIRSPLSTIASWVKVPKEFDSSWDIMAEWRYALLKNGHLESHYFGYEKWKEAAILFERLKEDYRNQFYLIRYIDMLTDPENSLGELFQFLELELQRPTLDFISQSQNTASDDPYSVYKVKTSDDGWKGVLPESIIQSIRNDLDGTKLNKYL